MNILGIIAEYNPCHLGHEYHINKSKLKTNADAVISVMSGSFVQRGEPACIDKWTRSQMALNAGVDLVIELPFIFATQSAEIFAEGGIRLLDSLNIVDYISFGSEYGDIELLNNIAKILVDKPKKYTDELEKNLKLGLSYPIARSNSLNLYFSHINNFEKIINSSNNILAIEYLKALYKYNSKIKPVTIKRVGSNYNDLDLNEKLSSASSIRNNIKNNNLNDITKHMNIKNFNLLKDFYNKNCQINDLYKYEDIIFYILRTYKEEDLNNIIDAEHGLMNRIINNSYKTNDLSTLINKSVSKIHTRTRIQRVLTHILNNLSKDNFNSLNNIYPSYIRVLASNSKGLEVLNLISKNSNMPIITKFSNYKKLKNKKINEIIYFDKKSTDIFYLPFKDSPMNQDYYKSPYIKK